MLLKFLNWIDAVRFRVKNGYWCTHTKPSLFEGGGSQSTFTRWQLVDLGRGKVRFCTQCDRTEVV